MSGFRELPVDGRMAARLWESWVGVSDADLLDVVNDDAVCRDEAELMFPEPDDLAGIAEARDVCAACPVQAQCLLLALRTGEDEHGVWGGFTPEERHTLHRSASWHLTRRAAAGPEVA
ncbi:MAG: WhiB family transcriptional regulator [Streptomycetales bacterium]